MKTGSANKEKIEPGDDRVLAESSKTYGEGAKCLAHQLRALGQALEKFNFAAFDLENMDGTYQVIARTTVENGKPSFSLRVRELLSRPFPTKSTSEAGLVVLRFSSEDIERFDLHGKSRRQDANQMPNPHSISQILRGVGSYIDHNKVANLVGISLNGPWVTTSYQTVSQNLEGCAGKSRILR